MSEYTAEDFAWATFARHSDGRTARRERHGIWDAGRNGPKRNDGSMAAEGWVPVVENSEAIAGLRHNLALARKELANLREENDRLERILQAPLSLKDLEVAWEAAEVATDYRKGDTLIEFFTHGSYRVYPAVRDYSYLPTAVRILSRAPKREPWQDLADVLRALTGEPDPDETARMLYEYGVRVTGGDES